LHRCGTEAYFEGTSSRPRVPEENQTYKKGLQKNPKKVLAPEEALDLGKRGGGAMTENLTPKGVKGPLDEDG